MSAASTQSPGSPQPNVVLPPSGLDGEVELLDVCGAEGKHRYPRTHAILLDCAKALASGAGAYQAILMELHHKRGGDARQGPVPADVAARLELPPQVRLRLL
jgi:hypothetical protein